jgi:hypothetical protein
MLLGFGYHETRVRGSDPVQVVSAPLNHLFFDVFWRRVWVS